MWGNDFHVQSRDLECKRPLYATSPNIPGNALEVHFVTNTDRCAKNGIRKFNLKLVSCYPELFTSAKVVWSVSI